MKNTLRFFGLAVALMAFVIPTINSMGQTTMEEFLLKWENGKQFTLEVVDKMPENLYDYKPGPEGSSFKELITHLAGAIVGISKGFLKGEEPGFATDFEPKTKAELKAYVASCYDYGKKTFMKLDEEELSEKIESFAGSVSRRQMIGLIDDHCTHHRGAAISYIRANGIEPPRFRAI